MSTQKCPSCGGEIINNNGVYTCEQCKKSFKAKVVRTKPVVQSVDNNETNAEEIKSQNLCVEFKEKAADKIYFIAGILLGLFMSIFGVAVACSVAPIAGRREFAKGSLIGFFVELGLGVLGGIIAVSVIGASGGFAS